MDTLHRYTVRKKQIAAAAIWFAEAKEMTDKHLANAIKMIEDGRLNRKWALPFLKGEQKRRKRQAFIDNFFDNLLKGAQESAEEPLPIVNGTLHN